MRKEIQKSTKLKPTDKVMDLGWEREIEELRLRKDILFLKERYFKSVAGTARVLGVVPKVLRDFLKGCRMHDARYVEVLARLNVVQRLCKEADKYDAAKNFQNLNFDTNKYGESNDR